MFVPDDKLTVLFQGDKFKFPETWNKLSRPISIVGLLITGIIVSLVNYFYLESGLPSGFKWIILAVIVLTSLALLILLDIKLSPTNYTVALDESAHYLVIKRTTSTYLGKVVRSNHHDLHKIKKLDFQNRKNYLLMQLHLDNNEIIELELPDEKIANEIRAEIRQVLDSGQEPNEAARKAYDVKFTPVVKILSEDDPLTK